MSSENMLKLIEAGIMAPSADNMQPWKFKIQTDILELWIERKMMGLFFDPADVATKIGCGALIENIDHYTRHLGLSMAVSYDSSEHENHIASLKISPGNAVDEDAFSTEIFTRCTDRNLYSKKRRITDAVCTSLTNSVKTADNYALTFYDSPDQRKRIIRTVVAADTIRFSHAAIHNDFYDVLRFGDTAEVSKDGLAESTLGIESFFIPILKQLKPWKLTNLLNKVGLHHIMALRGTWLPMVSAPSLVSIVHTGPADYIEFGRVIERFWLQATQLGLSVQPLGAFPLFLARLQLLNGDGFSESQIATLKQLERGFTEITPQYQDADGQLVMLFRLGYGKKAPNRSLRRPANSFLI